MNTLFEDFKILADKKKTVSDRDIDALVSGSHGGNPRDLQA